MKMHLFVYVCLYMRICKQICGDMFIYLIKEKGKKQNDRVMVNVRLERWGDVVWNGRRESY